MKPPVYPRERSRSTYSGTQFYPASNQKHPLPMAIAINSILLLAVLLLISTVPPSSQLPLEDNTVPACFHPVLTCKIKGKTFEFENVCGKKCRCNRPETEICDPGCNDDVKNWFVQLTNYNLYFKRCKEIRKTLMIDYE